MQDESVDVKYVSKIMHVCVDLDTNIFRTGNTTRNVNAFLDTECGRFEIQLPVPICQFVGRVSL